jgi:acyl carrier protein
VGGAVSAEPDIGRLVREVLIKEARVNRPPEELGDDEELGGDGLRISSLAFVGVILSFEDALDVTLDEELFMSASFRTLGDVVAFVRRAYEQAHGEVGA